MTSIEAKLREFMLFRRPIPWPEDQTARIMATPFELLGYDSLEIVELVMDCEQHWRIEIHDSVLSDNMAPSALVAIVRGAVAGEE